MVCVKLFLRLSWHIIRNVSIEKFISRYTYVYKYIIIIIYMKYFCVDIDVTKKQKVRATVIRYGRTLIVADLKRCEAKKFGGPDVNF